VTVALCGRWSELEPDDGRGKKPTLEALKELTPLSHPLFTHKQDPHHPASDLVNRGPRSCGWQSARWAFCEEEKRERERRESETEKDEEEEIEEEKRKTKQHLPPKKKKN